MANIDIDKDEWNISEIFNQIAVDTDNDGIPDAIAVCNPDGTPIESGSDSGEVNDGQNIGTDGVGIYKEKQNETLLFKKINKGSNKISVIDDINNDEVKIDVVESEIDHNNLQNIGTLTHTELENEISITNSALNNHINDTGNPHQVSLEQARSVDEKLSGNVDFQGNRILNLPSPNTNNEPLIKYQIGDIKYYNDELKKDLGTDFFHIFYLRDSNSITNSLYLRLGEGMSSSDTENSYYLPFNCVLDYVIISQANTDASWTLQIRRNGDDINLFQTTLETGSKVKMEENVNLDFDKLDRIQARLKIVSGTIEYPLVQLFFRRRYN